jgi:uncharacterized membrane protein
VGGARLGLVSYAVGLAAIGVLSLASGDFAFVWQPVPAWVPFHAPLAYFSGVMLVAGGLGMLVPRFAVRAGSLLTANMGLWLLLLRIPPAALNATNESMWLGCGETTVLVTGGWILVLMLRAGSGRLAPIADPAPGTVRMSRFLYGVALLLIGPSHFVYWKFTAAMIPGWIPAHVPFAYLTGAGHIAAGLAIVFGVMPRLAATFEAAMITIFTVVVGVAGVLGDPHSRMQWTALFISVAMMGGAWALAGSYADRSWLSVGVRRPVREAPLPA